MHSTAHIDMIELAKQEKMAWGAEAHGFYKEIKPGVEQWIVHIPQIGRRFIRGRAVYHFFDKTILGEEYFWPAGEYGGRILR